MSDDDPEIEIETDEDYDVKLGNKSPINTNANVAQKDKRAHHNLLERKRRDHIKDSFTQLRESIPTINSEKVASRAQILKKTADYIQMMTLKTKAYQKTIDELKEQNNDLDKQIVRMRELLKSSADQCIEINKMNSPGYSNSPVSDEN